MKSKERDFKARKMELERSWSFTQKEHKKQNQRTHFLAPGFLNT
jgi:hypothetical protein